MELKGKLVDIHLRKAYPASVIVEGDRISRISAISNSPDVYILPGLIDSHIHIESSMVTPGAFALSAVRHGTTGVVSDPHEIANVLGMEGILYMIQDSEKVPLRFWFGASSCVPATSYESSGARIGQEEIEKLLERNDIKYLSEMMNFPGVIFGDGEVWEKIRIAKKFKKPIDGHAPGLTGEMLRKYVSAGITTDHECSNIEEAREKISLGMKILIREGSAARNLDALKELYRTNPEDVMLCSDDLHPEMLEKGHINKLVSRLVSEGYDVFDVLRSASINPVQHYGLEAGLLRVGDSADLIIADKPENMNIIETWIAGKRVYGEGKTWFSYEPGKPVNNFYSGTVSPAQLEIKNEGKEMRVIEAMDGELFTREIIIQPQTGDFIVQNTGKDLLKIVVKERYMDKPPVAGMIKGFGLKSGAFASSVAHDSHNIICVGTNDHDMADAINAIVGMKGGLAVSVNGRISALELNIAGIMTNRSCGEVAARYLELEEMVISLGCRMRAPFMTLSFMALLVIPDLKIGDGGLFDVRKFNNTGLFI